jgi:glycerol-3-phosphate dehydrogenase
LVAANGAGSTDAFPDGLISHLKHRYGPQYSRVVALAKRDAQLRGPISEDLPYIWAELTFAVENEMAVTVEDFLSRRTHILNEAADNGVTAAPNVASRMGELLGWDKTQVDEQITLYADEVARVMAFRR